jgi:hypothetical protein
MIYIPMFDSNLIQNDFFFFEFSFVKLAHRACRAMSKTTSNGAPEGAHIFSN